MECTDCAVLKEKNISYFFIVFSACDKLTERNRNERVRVEGESDRTLKGISRYATAMTVESSGEKEVDAFLGIKEIVLTHSRVIILLDFY